MLPPPNRMRRSEDFRRAVRRGHRVSAVTLVVHAVESHDGSVRIGFVVSRAVGNSAVRHRVKRRLRHAMRPRLAHLSASLVVVRALPPAAAADFTALDRDLERCLSRIKAARG